MKRILLLLLISRICVFGASNAWAADDAATKFGRGLCNTVFGWFEIVNEIGNESDTKGPWIGFPSGLIRGTILGLNRTLAGIYEVVTFLVPNGKGDYEPILQPEFVFSRR